MMYENNMKEDDLDEVLYENTTYADKDKYQSENIKSPQQAQILESQNGAEPTSEFDHPLRPAYENVSSSEKDSDYRKVDADPDSSGIRNRVVSEQPQGTRGSRLEDRATSVVPLYGLQLLHDVEKLVIQQTYELTHLLSESESENRYLIKAYQDGDENERINYGEVIFGCLESSRKMSRMFCGSRRAMKLLIVDSTHREAFSIERRFASSCPLIGCYLQRIMVYEPQYKFIGSVEQEWSPAYPHYTIKNHENTTMFHVTSNSCLSCTAVGDSVFYLFDANWNDLESNISNAWSTDLGNYQITVTFPTKEMSNRSKALIVSTAFLLEYVYFIKSKVRNKYFCTCNF